MNVPFPFRVAAGVMAVGLDRLRTLPADIPALSVSLAGHAVRASMRFQQELAQLAARGEEVLSPLTDRPEENPPWAHFDEDDEYVVDAVAVDDGVVHEPFVDEAPAGKALAADGVPDTGGSRVEANLGRDGDAMGGRGPAEIPEYDDLRVSQLRSRLGDMDTVAVANLLQYEQGGRARAAYLTTLQNRLTSLESDSERRTKHRSAT